MDFLISFFTIFSWIKLGGILVTWLVISFISSFWFDDYSDSEEEAEFVLYLLKKKYGTELKHDSRPAKWAYNVFDALGLFAGPFLLWWRVRDCICYLTVFLIPKSLVIP